MRKILWNHLTHNLYIYNVDRNTLTPCNPYIDKYISKFQISHILTVITLGYYNSFQSQMFRFCFTVPFCITPVFPMFLHHCSFLAIRNNGTKHGTVWFCITFLFFSNETTEQKRNSVFLYHFSVFTIRNNGTKTKHCVFALLFRFFIWNNGTKNGPLVGLLSSTKIFLKP